MDMTVLSDLGSAFVLPALLSAVAAYFCGCFNGAVIVSKYILRDDVRNHGSGNAGLTNFHRTFGGGLTFVVILCDVLKAVLAVLLGSWLFVGNPMLGKYFAALFCLLGHMFPCMFHFKGGKGILSGGTIALMIDWRVALVVWDRNAVCFPGLPVGRGQLPLYQLVLLPGGPGRGAGLPPGGAGGLAAPGQRPAAAPGHGTEAELP